MTADFAAAEPMPRASLRARAVAGLKIASIATVGKTVVDAAAQLALARLLAPEHFGLFALAQAYSGFASCFGDLSGQKFLIRVSSPTRRTVSTVFWTELLLGALVALLWVVAAPLVLGALGHSERVTLAQALAVWIFAERLLLPRALLDREMRFGQVNIALFSGVCIGAAAGLYAAWAGCGAWAFVIALIARTVVSGALVWRATRFRPSFEFDIAGVRQLAAFGLPLLGGTALAFAYTNVDYLIVGGAAGASALGFYYAAYRYPHYLNQFNVLLASVVFPSFAKTKDDAHLARGLRLLTRYSAAFSFPFAIAMWLEGDTLLRVLLGEKWLPALFAFQCFTTLAVARLTFSHWNHVLVARGITKPVFYAGLVNLPLIAGAAALGVTFGGIDGAALGVTLAALATLAACCGIVLKRHLAFRYTEALAPVLIASVAAVGAGVGAGALLPATAFAPAISLVAAAGWYAAVLFMSCGRELRGVMSRSPSVS